MYYDIYYKEYALLCIDFCFIASKQTIQHQAYDHDPYAKEFGIKVSEKLASVEARILPAPWVIFNFYVQCGLLLSTVFIAHCLLILLSAAKIS